MAICLCGHCGLEAKEGKKFISGHNWRNKKRGAMPEETRQKLSLSTKNAMADPIIRERIFWKKSKYPIADLSLLLFCACGCGERIKIKRQHGEQGYPKFIAGHHTKLEKYKESNSDRATKRLITCGNLGGYNYIRGKYFSKKNKKEIRYDSSYELKAFELLECTENVLSFDRCDFFIKYEREGHIRRYTPDIFVNFLDGRQSVIEVKPQSRVKEKETDLKRLAGENFCKEKGYTYEIWTEIILKIERN